MNIRQHLPDGFPKVVCLCGSTRFMDVFHEAGWALTLEGQIVLTVGVCKHAEDHGGEALGQDVADRLDELHRRKIDLADWVFVLNVGGYIGHSTRGEIEYAHATGKHVGYLEDVSAASTERNSMTTKEETLKYELSNDQKGLMRFCIAFDQNDEEKRFTDHVHSDEMTRLERWIHGLLSSIPSSALSACPFCGSPAIGTEKTLWFKAVIRCANRLCQTTMWSHDQEPLASVAARWNTRHANAGHEARRQQKQEGGSQ